LQTTSKWSILLNQNSVVSSALPSRALQRVSLNIGQKMQEVKRAMKKNQELYAKLTNARSSNDLKKIEQG